MKVDNYHLGFVGFGHMGQIILQALNASKLIPRSQILFHRRDPGKAKHNEQNFGITATSLGHLIRQSHLILICVPPHQAEPVLREMAKEGAGSKMIVSIMAGIKILFIQKYFDVHTQILRVMPNIASSLMEGVSLFSFGAQPQLEFRSLANLVFSTLGQVVEIAEQQMDIGCGMSGSGPAFVLELIDAMARLGVKEGMPYDKALKIAAQTFSGAAHLILKGATPENLLNQISTPGGTTVAGLDALRQGETAERFQAAILAAAQRSKKISEEFS